MKTAQRRSVVGDRPSFVFIITDQHRADHLGCYGNRVLQTPNIDTLAARGTVFDRFYVASPVCMPNRATWLTGRMPSLHKVRSNGIPLHFSNVTFPELLRASGYRTALIGKSHLQNMTDRAPLLVRSDEAGLPRVPGLNEATRLQIDGTEYGQERRSRWRDPAHRVSTPYYGFDEVELCNGHGDAAFGDYDRWAQRREPLFDQLRGRVNAIPDPRYAAPQAWRTRVPEELYSTHYIAERAIAWLEQRVRHYPAEPFFLAISFPDPHHPFTPPGRYWDLYSPADVLMPRAFRATRNDAPRHVQWLHAERAAGRAALNSTAPYAVTEREARESIALTYGMITMIDERIGRVLGALERTQLASRTIVVFTSDHGDFMGDHGVMLKGPMHYSGLVRVPFIWSEPHGRTGQRRQDLAGTLDIATTVLCSAGVAPANGMQGRNLFAGGVGAACPLPDCMLIEEDTQAAMVGFDDAVRARTVIMQRSRLTVYLGAGWGEIYDLAEDPYEERNLWDTPGSRELQTDLLHVLADAAMAACDRSPVPTAAA